MSESKQRRKAVRRTRNPYRVNKLSHEYQAWENGYEAGLLNEIQKRQNPHKCPVITPEKQLLAKIWEDAHSLAVVDSKLVTEGIYCYTGKKVCPYLGSRRAYANRSSGMSQSYGYCHLLRKGDFFEENGTDLLWDQVKECGINTAYEGEE